MKDYEVLRLAAHDHLEMTEEDVDCFHKSRFTCTAISIATGSPPYDVSSPIRKRYEAELIAAGISLRGTWTERKNIARVLYGAGKARLQRERKAFLLAIADKWEAAEKTLDN